MYDNTSADRSGRRTWTSDANKCLDSLCHKPDIFICAVGGLNVLHNNVPESPFNGRGREKSVHPRDSHVGLKIGIQKLFGNPVLGQRFADGDIRTIFDPGDDTLSRLTGGLDPLGIWL